MVPLAQIDWRPSYRLVSTKYPPVNFFEEFSSDPEEWEVLAQIESLTDPGLKMMDLSKLPVEDRFHGSGAALVLPSFTFLNLTLSGSRFSSNQFGAYYAGKTLETAIAETSHHRSRFMSDTRQPAQELDQRLILADISGMLHDIRNMQEEFATIYDTNDYSHSQSFAAKLRQEGSSGIAYKSVRLPGGENVAILSPRVISNARQDKAITLQWNGARITGYYEKRGFRGIEL